MKLELDHIFVCTDVGAPEAGRLLALGLCEGEPNTHPGQGTSNRRFFFHNAMLELIWVHDQDEARSEATRRTRLFDRWRLRAEGACPFGLCVRSAEGCASPPFPSWGYTAHYLPPPLEIRVGANSDILAEPMLFYIAFGRRPDIFPESKRQPLEHPIGFREITRLRSIAPKAPISPELAAVSDGGILSLGEGAVHALEIGFDGETQGKSANLGPELPVTLHW